MMSDSNVDQESVREDQLVPVDYIEDEEQDLLSQDTMDEDQNPSSQVSDDSLSIIGPSGDLKEPDTAVTVISRRRFFDSVLLLTGLCAELSENEDDEEEPFDLSFLVEDEENANIVNDMLTFVYNEFFFDGSNTSRGLWIWMENGISAIIDMMNTHPLHPFMEDSQVAFEDFLAQVGCNRQLYPE